MSSFEAAVIWDLDGVILDSSEQHRLAWHRLAKEEDIPFTDADFWATFGKRNDDIFSIIYGLLAPERLSELAGRKEAYFRELIKEGVAPLPGAMELMKELQAAGFAQALASSTPTENIALISEVLGLRRYLTVLVSGEGVERGKPAPDIFLKAAQELGVKAENSLVIEDAVAGVQAAHAAGMRCIAVLGNRDLAQLPALRKAELIVKTLTEVDAAQVHALLNAPLRGSS